ncbi:hypothetical protein DV738_g1165, partial [Chaetothyriales sp. CBS 135597]
MALVYAILYLYFQAYPIIFQVMAGATLAMSIFIWYSSYYEKAVKAGKSWTEIEEFRRLPLACISGPLVVSSLFWLGWTSYKSIHPAVPMMAGLFFGTGYLLVFMAMINYLTDIYKQYSASAQAAASTIRSIAAVFLPMATRPMYDRLGIQGGGSLLGGIALLMAGIPFVFIMYRDFIRGRSPFAKRALEEDRRNQAAAQANDEGGEKLADNETEKLNAERPQNGGGIWLTTLENEAIFHNEYDLEVLEDEEWYRASADDCLPSQHFAMSGCQPVSEEIENIIVSVKATQTVDALRSLKKRLSSRSTILFLQNGYGMIEAVNTELFPDPSNRPKYISGVISHIVGKNSPFNVTHHGLSAVSLGLVPDRSMSRGGVSRDSNESHSTNSAMETPFPIPNYLLDNLPKVPRFNATNNPYNLHLLHLLEKLTVNAFCNPLCALADAPNAYLFTIPETRRALLTEISNVINSLPERDIYFDGAELAEFCRRFKVSQLEKTVSAIIEKTQSGTCSMVWDLRAGRETEIRFINGYWSRRGREVGVPTPLNDKLIEQIERRTRRTKASTKELEDSLSYLPLELVESSFPLSITGSNKEDIAGNKARWPIATIASPTGTVIFVFTVHHDEDEGDEDEADEEDEEYDHEDEDDENEDDDDDDEYDDVEDDFLECSSQKRSNTSSIAVAWAIEYGMPFDKSKNEDIMEDGQYDDEEGGAPNGRALVGELGRQEAANTQGNTKAVSSQDGSRELPPTPSHHAASAVSGHKSGSSKASEADNDSISAQSIVPFDRQQQQDHDSIFSGVIGSARALASAPNSEADTGNFHSARLMDEEDLYFETEFAAVEDDSLSDQDVHEAWKAKKKHFLILSAAGKPIYSRHGSHLTISSYIAIIQTIISSYNTASDQLKSFHADTFTRGSPSALLSALECLKLRKSHRSVINSTLVKARVDELLYGLVVAGARLVSVIRPKKHSLHPSDLHLIFNMLFEAEGIKAGGGESWIPICLPGFNKSGYLFMYVSYLNMGSDTVREVEIDEKIAKEDAVAIILLSADRESFESMQSMKNYIVHEMRRNRSIGIVQRAVQAGRLQPTDIVPGTVLRHFLFKSKPNVQFFMPSLSPHFDDLNQRRQLMTVYHLLHASVHAKHAAVKVHHRVSSTSSALAWVTPMFELYCVAGPNTPRNALAQSANKVVQWIQREEERVFIIGGAVF